MLLVLQFIIVNLVYRGPLGILRNLWTKKRIVKYVVLGWVKIYCWFCNFCAFERSMCKARKSDNIEKMSLTSILGLVTLKAMFLWGWVRIKVYWARLVNPTIQANALKVRQSRKDFFKPTFLPKNERTNEWMNSTLLLL